MQIMSPSLHQSSRHQSRLFAVVDPNAANRVGYARQGVSPWVGTLQTQTTHQWQFLTLIAERY